jgi:hypothetical protein
VHVLAKTTRTCDFAFEGDVFDDDAPTDSMLELQMDGMKVTAEAWPRPRAVPPPLPQLGPPPTISKTKNRAIRPPPLPEASHVPRHSPPRVAAVDEATAIAAFAGFGPAPTSIFGMPGYALRVRARKRTLRRELATARVRSSFDVALYERALASANASAVRAGYAMIALAPALVAALVVAVLTVLSTR